MAVRIGKPQPAQGMGLSDAISPANSSINSVLSDVFDFADQYEIASCGGLICMSLNY